MRAIPAIYRNVFRPVLFRLDSERAHHAALGMARLAGRTPLRHMAQVLYDCEDPALETQCFGRLFSNPIGLAAGFDKDAQAVEMLSAFGFGFIELGSVTAQPQPGNPRPRVFRLPEDRAIINRMGFPSQGADRVRERLARLRSREQRLPPLGINLGKTKAVPIDDALQDYVTSFEKLQEFADYIVLNVSSPNTPELRKLQERPRLEALFRGVQQANLRALPLLVKIAPDLERQDLDDVLDVCLRCGVSGLIATNTTFSREGLTRAIDESGGLSGKPLHAKSVAMVSNIYRATEGKLPIIGVGGIFDSEHVWEFMRAGASLVQIYTGLVYEGPSIVRTLKHGLLSRLHREGIRKLSELVGTASTS